MGVFTINDRYGVDQEIGQGAQGVTLLATDRARGGARVVVKVYWKARLSDRAAWEFAQLARLDHDGIVGVHELGVIEKVEGGSSLVKRGQGFVVQQWIQGVPSTRWVEDARKGKGWVQALSRLLLEVAESLTYVHDRRLLHRDLKPGHVLVRSRRKLPRSVLIDFGLSLPVGDRRTGLTGTPGYIAPECLTGQYSPATDLYALGATAYRLVTGHRPVRVDERSSARSVIEAILRSRPRPVGEVCQQLPSWLAETVDRLLAVDPSDRPPSARALVDHLARHVRSGGRRRMKPVRTSVVARPPVRGRRVLVRDLVDAAMKRLDDPASPVDPVVILEGPRGMGKSTVLAELKRRLLLERASAGRDLPQFIEGDLRELLARVARHGSGSGILSGWIEGAGEGPPVTEMVRALSDRTLASTGAVLILRDVDELAARVLAGLAGRLTDADGAPVPLMVLAERDTDVGGGTSVQLDGLDGLRIQKLGPLGATHVDRIARFMMGPDAGDEAVQDVVDRSGGNPLYAMELAQMMASSPRPGKAHPGTLEELLERALEELEPELLRLLQALCLAPSRMDASLLAEVLGRGVAEIYGGLRAFEDRGWLEMREQSLEPMPLLAQRVEARMDPATRREMHARLHAAMEGKGRFHDWEISLAALRSDQGGAHVDVVMEGASRLARLGEPGRAIELVREAVRHLKGRRLGRASLELARLLRETGRYDEAMALLGSLGPQGGMRDLEMARCLRLSGDVARASELLLGLVGGSDATSEVGVQVRVLLARMHVDAQRSSEAITLLEDLAGQEGSAGRQVDILEPLGMALAREGRAEEALEAFRRGAQLAEGTGQALKAARFHSLQGRAHQEAGEYDAALEAYASAEELARKGGDSHAHGVYAMNLGAILTELCRYDEAAGKLVSAHQMLGAVGEVRELPLSLFNLAVLRSRIGDPEGTVDLVRRGARLARRQGQDTLLGYFTLIEADAARARGDLPEALALADRALSEFAGAGDEAGRQAALVSAADVASLMGDRAAAHRRIRAAREGGVREGPAADRLVLADARVAPRERQAREGVVARLEEAVGRFRARQDLENELRGRWLLYGLAGSADPRLARQVRRLAARLRKASSRLGYNPLRSDPELGAVERMQLMNPSASDSCASVGSAPSSGVENKWKRLVRINKRLNSELRLKPLLETILDTLLDLTGATRGFILIRGKDDQLRVKAARNIDEAGLPGGRKDFSSSIVQEVMETGRPLITVDAATDERFDALRSVHDLALKSVLCVPLSVRGQVTGAVYVDNPYSSDIFGGEDVELVMDFADQASIALMNARLATENRRREKRIERLNRKLEKALEKQQIELRGLRETLDRGLPAQPPSPGRYPEIVGDSEPMKKVFHLLDRISDSDLPAVITGESGTGKELVARAIHFHGPRKRGPFVVENCGAIPDTLLESVLFGHVRGAFTGADRDRPGLFEVASTGTLFLDEISSMSQPMQTKLLRALQEGIIRPLGGNAVKKVDVRILAASNSDLTKLVDEGSFREDLYYRINVVTIHVPALRERTEDVPALVLHFVQKHAQGRNVEVTREALSRLMSHRWPGNVRELENEVMRALVLGGDVIDERIVLPGKDLREPVEPADPEGSLDLREHQERLERSLIRRALERTGGNQSAAARELGVSRYGLIKKMKRLGI